MKLRILAGLGAVWAIHQTLRRPRPFDFRGRTVLITGGSRGLGFVLARQLAHQRANIIICGRNEQTVKEAERELQKIHGNVVGVRCDVGKKSDVDQLFSFIEQRFGLLDVLINNAGVIQVGPMELMTLEDYEEAMRTHFWGPVYTTLAALPGFRRRRHGRIVNISSIGGRVGVPHLLPYCASKFALAGFSEALRAELRKENIFVTTVCPGLMRTGSPRNADFKGDHIKEYAWFSISGSLPVISVNVERAAKKILEACRWGQAELLIGITSKMAVRAQALFPNFSAMILGQVNRVLPQGNSKAMFKGKESFSVLSPSPLTVLTERAARQNHELTPAGNEPVRRRRA